MKDLSERTISLFSDSTRDKLLKKSLELFNKKGYVSVTTSLLASSSNVREGNLWYHFKSKKNLVESHIELFKENISLKLEDVDRIDLESLIKKLFSQYYFNWDFRYLFRDNLVNNFPTDRVLTSKLNDLAGEGWLLMHVVSGVESDAGKDDGNGIFITRYIFSKRTK